MIMGFFILLCVILFCICVLQFIIFISSYLTHIHMNKDQNLQYDYVNFKTFINVFNEYMDMYKDNSNVDIKYGYHGSPAVFMCIKNNWNRYYIIYLHADIVKFENKCMIFYPWSYIKYHRWIRKFIAVKRIKGLWKDN